MTALIYYISTAYGKDAPTPLWMFSGLVDVSLLVILELNLVGVIR